MQNEPLWEAAAKSYVRAALEIAVWDFGLGVVLLPEIEQDTRPCRACSTLQELRAYLFQIARHGWNTCLPRGGEQPAASFESFDTGAVIDSELLSHRRTLELMQWKPAESAEREGVDARQREQSDALAAASK